MAEPTSALSYYDLILRVAREAGIAYYGSTGNERAMIPIDIYHFDKCKRIVNNAIMGFIATAPENGWRWKKRIMSVTFTATRITGTADDIGAASLVDAALAAVVDDDGDRVYVDDYFNNWYLYILTGTGTGCFAKITDYTATTGRCDIDDWLDAYGNPSTVTPAIGDTFAITSVETVGGDISRYPLAENFGGEVNGQIHYQEDTSHSALIEWRDESYIRANRAVSVTTGYPRYAAIRPLEFYAGGTGPKRRWELILDSDPVAADTLEFPYTLFFDELRIVNGISSGGSITTLIDASYALYYPDDYFNGWKCYIISGTGRNSQALVTGFAGTTFTITVANWLGIDNSSDTGEDPIDSPNSIYYLEPPGNLHPAGLRFDEVIKAACLAQAEMEIEDIAAGFVTKYAQKDLVKAYQADARSAPRKLGSMNLGERPPTRVRTWLNITTDHDM